MSPDYRRDLAYDQGMVTLSIYFETVGREVIDYAVILTLEVEGKIETIRVYDGAHGYNEMHRHTRICGKQAGTPFHAGNLGEGMRAAIEDIEGRYNEMIEGWRGR